MNPTHRFAHRLAQWAGDGTRAAELRSHLHDLEQSPNGVSIRDVGSIAVLAATHQTRRVARDVPWWLAGLPFAALLLLTFALSYETHFFAWDMIERTPDTTEARVAKQAVDGIFIVGGLFGAIAGRRAIEHVRSGRIAPPLILFLAIIVATSQGDLFIERTPWWRDGRLLESHVNEVPYYSIALIGAFALVPVAFVVADMIWSRRQHQGNTATDPEPTMQPRQVDARAVAAITLPLLQIVVGFLWIIPFLILVWMAAPFTLLDKVASTVATLVPIAALIGYLYTRPDAANDDLPGAVLIAVLAFQLAVWGRLTYLALRPLRAQGRAPIAALD